jgi:hypothetical protein
VPHAVATHKFKHAPTGVACREGGPAIFYRAGRRRVGLRRRQLGPPCPRGCLYMTTTHGTARADSAVVSLHCARVQHGVGGQGEHSPPRSRALRNSARSAAWGDVGQYICTDVCCRACEGPLSSVVPRVDPGPLTPPQALPPGWLATAMISIAASSALYTWIWYRPADFRTLIGRRDPCKARPRATTGASRAAAAQRCTRGRENRSSCGCRSG